MLSRFVVSAHHVIVEIVLWALLLFIALAGLLTGLAVADGTRAADGLMWGLLGIVGGAVVGLFSVVFSGGLMLVVFDIRRSVRQLERTLGNDDARVGTP